ncbi:MAG: polysaccharide deacetylase [Lachnospiraceae bacterium]|nr:polysaccharide deacetylase [Lachnospiraceae bacterium]MDE6064919.1 polysaccharide deacetylase [Lachnospiraceae bacterium]
MTAEKAVQPAARRKRVQRLKRLIILSLMTAILTPTVLCVILFNRLHILEKQIDRLETAVADMQEEQAAAVQAAGTNFGFSEGVVFHLELVQPPEPEEPEETGSAEDEPGVDMQEEEPVRKVYLTFDDGPSSNTNKILDILAQYDVKATFFVVGKEGEWAEDAYRRIVEEGHTLGMHSYTHVYKSIYASVEAYAEDLNRLKDYLYEVTGEESRFVRFPGGSSNTVSDISMREFITYLNEEGITYFDWNVSSGDAGGRLLEAEEIVANCINGMGNKDTVVILMHDAAGRPTTVEALPALIERIQEMENTELLPITDDTLPVQHIKSQKETED